MNQQFTESFGASINSDLDFLFVQTPARGIKESEKQSEKVNPMLLDSNFGGDHQLPMTPIKEELRPIKEEDVTLTSSGLLEKHNANIARLAQSFGINLSQNNKVENLLQQVEKDPIFDETQFKSKLAKMAENSPEPQKSPQKKFEEIESKPYEKPEAEQTFLSGDIFKMIKEKYMRDSVQYSKPDLFETGMNSMSSISQSIIQNKETKLGVLQQSIKSESMRLSEDFQPKDVREILAKYKSTAKNSWLDEMDSVEQTPDENFSDIENIRKKYMNIFQENKFDNSAGSKNSSQKPVVEASIDNLLNTIKSQKNPFNVEKYGSPMATAKIGNGLLEPLEEEDLKSELRSDLESKRNLQNGTPVGEGSELQNFLTERDEAPLASERVIISVEKVQEDDQLSNILSQDSKVLSIDKSIDKTIDEIPKKSQVDLEEKSDTQSKTQLAHQTSKTSRQISDITELTNLNIAQTPKIHQTPGYSDIKIEPTFQKLQTKRDTTPKLNFDFSRIDTQENPGASTNKEYLEELKQIQDMMKSIKEMDPLEERPLEETHHDLSKFLEPPVKEELRDFSPSIKKSNIQNLQQSIQMRESMQSGSKLNYQLSSDSDGNPRTMSPGSVDPQRLKLDLNFRQDDFRRSPKRMRSPEEIKPVKKSNKVSTKTRSPVVERMSSITRSPVVERKSSPLKKAPSPVPYKKQSPSKGDMLKKQLEKQPIQPMINQKSEPELVKDNDSHISFRSSSSDEMKFEAPKKSQLDHKLSQVLEYESEASSNYMPRECRKLMETDPPLNTSVQLSNLSAIREEPQPNYLLDLLQTLSLDDPSIKPLAKIIVPLAQQKQGHLDLQKQLLKIQEIAQKLKEIQV